MQSEELKPCPFCGYALTTCEGICEGYVDGSEEEEVEFTGICCPGCAVFLPKQTEKGTAIEGIQAWNRRAEAALSAAEPVAWRIVGKLDSGSTTWKVVEHEHQAREEAKSWEKMCAVEVHPLYAASPAPSVAVKALKPFATDADIYDGQDIDDGEKSFNDNITVGNLRRARAAYVALSAQVQDVTSIEVWVCIGDDHDYDVISQWLIGVFYSADAADAAGKSDVSRYVAETGNDPDRHHYEVHRAMLAAAPAKQEG